MLADGTAKRYTFLIMEDKVKRVILLVFLITCLAGFVFAQQASEQQRSEQQNSNQTSSRFRESEYYYFNYTVEKVLTYRLGLIVVYRVGTNRLARTFIPQEWFSTIGGKGEIIYLGSGMEWPSMVVYHKNGEFSHVRLRLRRDRTHETWGVVPLNVNIDEYFKGIEELELEY